MKQRGEKNILDCKTYNVTLWAFAERFGKAFPHGGRLQKGLSLYQWQEKMRRGLIFVSGCSPLPGGGDQEGPTPEVSASGHPSLAPLSQGAGGGRVRSWLSQACEGPA